MEESKRDQDLQLRIRGGQAAGLTGVAKHKRFFHWLIDAQDLSGQRLRLWDLSGTLDRGALHSALNRHFPEVVWLDHPLPGSVWILPEICLSQHALEVEAEWRSAPVGYLVVRQQLRSSVFPSKKRAAHELQKISRKFFTGFDHARFLGVLSSPAAFDLLDLFKMRGHGTALDQEIVVFKKWLLEWREAMWQSRTGFHQGWGSRDEAQSSDS